MKKALLFIPLVVVVLIVVSFFYIKNSKTDVSQVVNVYSSLKEELVHSIFDEFTKKPLVSRYVISLTIILNCFNVWKMVVKLICF